MACVTYSTRSPRRGSSAASNRGRGPLPERFTTPQFLKPQFLSTEICPVRKDSHV